jgi:hypothetical protein
MIPGSAFPPGEIGVARLEIGVTARLQEKKDFQVQSGTTKTPPGQKSFWRSARSRHPWMIIFQI